MFKENFEVYKKELKENIDDFENRYTYFHETIQTDLGSIVNTQKESNFSIEKFVEMVDKRTELFESNTEKNLDGIRDTLNEFINNQNKSGSGGSLDLESFNSSIHQFKLEIKKNASKLKVVDGKVDNFRNEVNRMFLDYETEMSQKNEKYTTAIASISRQAGLTNPLL